MLVGSRGLAFTEGSGSALSLGEEGWSLVGQGCHCLLQAATARSPPTSLAVTLLAPRERGCCSSEPTEGQSREGAQREEDGGAQRGQREQRAARGPGRGGREAGHAVPGLWTWALPRLQVLPCPCYGLTKGHRVVGLMWVPLTSGLPREPRNSAGAYGAGHLGQPCPAPACVQ